MKIAIDTFGSEHGRSGFGSYILNFISNLPQELSSQKLTGTTINADTNKGSSENENSSDKKNDIQIELFGLEDDRYTYTSGKDIPFTSTKISSGVLIHRRIQAQSKEATRASESDITAVSFNDEYT